MKKHAALFSLCLTASSLFLTSITANAVSIAPIVSPEAGYPAALGELQYCGMAAYADQEALSTIAFASDNEPAIYCTSATPNYTYAAQGLRTFPMNTVYAADHQGSSVTFLLSDMGEDAPTSDELQTLIAEYFDESYTVTVDAANGCVIGDAACREETRIAAQSLYTALCGTYKVAEFVYAKSNILLTQLSCGGALYALSDYPEAEAELTAFAAEYAPDWTPIVFGNSYVQMVPTDSETDNAANLELAKMIYETLGYEIYVGVQEDVTMTIASEIVNMLAGSGDIDKDEALTISDVVLLSRYVAEDTTVPITEEGIAVADVNGDGGVTADDITALLRRLVALK